MPTYHYVQNQGKRMMQSRGNGQNSQSGQFFDDFAVNYLQIANFSEKWVPFKLKVIFSINFRLMCLMSNFGLIWKPFREYLQMKNFFQKSGSVTFLPL